MPWQTLCINAESKISLDQNNIVIKKADGTYQSYNLRAIDCVILHMTEKWCACSAPSVYL